ncbi:hypothetical protein MRX96_019812 [Rhipicephalus microplus]
MTEKRFFKLRNNLHIVPEDFGFDSEDRLWKVRPFMELIRKRCLELALEQECSVDEQMIPFKGQLSIKQYVKGKPSPWGIKVFALCSSSGLLYQGENTIPANLKKEYGDQQKKPRGYSAEYVTSDDVVVVIWEDNNDVLVVSKFVGIGNEEDVRRWDKTKRKHIFVKQPEVIVKCNRSMGGVDKMDFLLSLYRTKIRSKKWTLRAIFHFVDLAVCNAWVKYLRENAHTRRSKLLDLLHFRLQIAEALISSVPNTRKRGRPSYKVEPADVPEERKARFRRPCSDARYDGMDHCPEARDRTLPSRCKYEGCKERSRVFCKKCEVPLCITKDRNCYYKFHA